MISYYLLIASMKLTLQLSFILLSWVSAFFHYFCLSCCKNKFGLVLRTWPRSPCRAVCQPRQEPEHPDSWQRWPSPDPPTSSWTCPPGGRVLQLQYSPWNTHRHKCDSLLKKHLFFVFPFFFLKSTFKIKLLNIALHLHQFAANPSHQH